MRNLLITLGLPLHIALLPHLEHPSLAGRRSLGALRLSSKPHGPAVNQFLGSSHLIASPVGTRSALLVPCLLVVENTLEVASRWDDKRLDVFSG